MLILLWQFYNTQLLAAEDFAEARDGHSALYFQSAPLTQRADAGIELEEINVNGQGVSVQSREANVEFEEARSGNSVYYFENHMTSKSVESSTGKTTAVPNGRVAQAKSGIPTITQDNGESIANKLDTPMTDLTSLYTAQSEGFASERFAACFSSMNKKYVVAFIATTVTTVAIIVGVICFAQ